MADFWSVFINTLGIFAIIASITGALYLWRDRIDDRVETTILWIEYANPWRYVRRLTGFTTNLLLSLSGALFLSIGLLNDSEAAEFFREFVGVDYGWNPQTGFLVVSYVCSFFLFLRYLKRLYPPVAKEHFGSPIILQGFTLTILFNCITYGVSTLFLYAMTYLVLFLATHGPSISELKIIDIRLHRFIILTLFPILMLQLFSVISLLFAACLLAILGALNSMVLLLRVIGWPIIRYRLGVLTVFVFLVLLVAVFSWVTSSF